MRKQLFVMGLVAVLGCSKEEAASTTQSPGPSNTGQGAAQPAVSASAAAPFPGDPKDIAHIAAGSPDHTTLVTALKAADLVDSLTNAGPFTAFAPTNAAFDKLPKGTVEGLLKPDKKDDLKKILQYHVMVSKYPVKGLVDGQKLGMANGKSVTVHVTNGKVSVNNANIVATIEASNGLVHVIDAVLLPE